ncbi:MAG: hypothetical protein ACYTFO_10125, partial [Planctomycetota bacterium]
MYEKAIRNSMRPSAVACVVGALCVMGIVGTLTLPGCIAIATVKLVSKLETDTDGDGQNDEYVATVQIDRSPAEVYAAASKVLDARGDMRVARRDAASHRVDAVKGRDTVSVKATSLGDNSSQVLIAAQSD